MVKFEKIKEIIDGNRHLIGQKVDGATIEELVPIPVVYAEEFKKYYVRYLDAEEAFGHFIKDLGVMSLGKDYEVYAVMDKHRIRTEGVFLSMELEELKERYNLM